jgi:hypothetical protein
MRSHRKRLVAALGALLFLVPASPVQLAFAEADHEAAGSGRAAQPAAPVLRRPDGPPAGTVYDSDAPVARGSFFPRAVWFESVISDEEAQQDKAAGLNTYLQLTTNTDLDIVRRSGMRSVTDLSKTDPRLSGYLLPDEVDMWAGPGNGEWTGNWPGQGQICVDDQGCGYTIFDSFMRGVPANRFVYGQFGKGVLFWQSTEQARGHVNEHPDAVSADAYWFTDPNICGRSEGGWFFGQDEDISEQRCRRPVNYGLTVDKMQRLVRPAGSKPVWVFVELGHPAGEDSAPSITPVQVQRATWSGIIHGARGVAYFNHNFGGPCFSFHVLRDECGKEVRPAVTRLNKQIQMMAPVLNAPFADHVASVESPLELSTKLHNGRFHLIVGSRRNGAASGTVTLSCGNGQYAVDRVSGRRYPIRDGAFDVELTATTPVRLFRIEGGDICGLGA